jgi:hypothetical protein
MGEKPRDRLWITTPGEIARYCESLPKGTVPGIGVARGSRALIPGHCVIAIAAPSVTIDNTVLSSTVAFDSLE